MKIETYISGMTNSEFFPVYIQCMIETRLNGNMLAETWE